MTDKTQRHLVRVALVALGMALISCGCAWGAQQNGGPITDIDALMSSVSATSRMMEHLVPIVPRVHAIHAELSAGPAPLANEMVIEQRDGFVLVDAGKTRGAGLRIVALIRSLGSKPVKAVIITHWHQDHVLGLGPIVEAWPHAKVVASRGTLALIEGDESYRNVPRAGESTVARDAARASALRAYAEQTAPKLQDPSLSPEERSGWADVAGVLAQRIADDRGTYLVAPTTLFDHRYRIDDPTAPVEVRFLGEAHTAGDVVIWMPRQRVVASGDMVVAPIPFGGPGALSWINTLRALIALNPRYVVPGHGPVLEGTRYVRAIVTAMEDFRRQAALLVDGPELDDDAVLAKVDVDAQERGFAGDDRWLRYWFRAYFANDVPEIYHRLREARVAARRAESQR